MTSFVALYRGITVGEAKLLAVSAAPALVEHVAGDPRRPPNWVSIYLFYLVQHLIMYQFTVCPYHVGAQQGVGLVGLVWKAMEVSKSAFS